MTGVRGYFHPKTATGAASLVPAPPWRYSGDLLTVEYRTDPARVRELLPPPLEPAPDDPGAVALIWADWQSCSASGEELLDPVRAQYKEAFAAVRCSYRGRLYSRCVYIWVDKDFAIARGLHQGYPKKLGSIHQTRPHPFGPAPRLEAGARLGATLAAADRRIAQAVVTLHRPSSTSGFVNAHPMAHHRWLPSIEKGKGLALDELVESAAASFDGGQAWTGEAELELFEAPTEELARLAVREPIAAYYRQVGVVWDGGRLLESHTSGAGD
ncbi:acetoacetate decarboxylase family protein [Streptomyces sp. NPDC059070]|uniref:acetoacetate decarboxylase family protein n=1 Tax=Streptomyces sp. NPDC059070 TaxID=3346713 RepID=UPI00369CCF61